MNTIHVVFSNSYLSDNGCLFLLCPLKVRVPAMGTLIFRNGLVEPRVLGGIESAVGLLGARTVIC